MPSPAFIFDSISIALVVGTTARPERRGGFLDGFSDGLLDWVWKGADARFGAGCTISPVANIPQAGVGAEGVQAGGGAEGAQAGVRAEVASVGYARGLLEASVAERMVFDALIATLPDAGSMMGRVLEMDVSNENVTGDAKVVGVEAETTEE